MDAKTLLKQMAAQRGYPVEPAFEWIAQIDPEFLEAFNRMTVEAFGLREDGSPKTSELPVKVKELLAVAILCGQRDFERLPGHLSRAIKYGATDKELLEVFELAGTMTGGPAMRGGVSVLMKVKGLSK